MHAECLGDGTSMDLGAALAGRTWLINVWASWCEVCRKELPVLDAYARSPGAVQVLGVQILSDPADGWACWLPSACACPLSPTPTAP